MVHPNNQTENTKEKKDEVENKEEGGEKKEEGGEKKEDKPNSFLESID